MTSPGSGWGGFFLGKTEMHAVCFQIKIEAGITGPGRMTLRVIFLGRLIPFSF